MLIFFLKYFRADVVNYNIELGFHLPRVEIKGKYEVNGNVLLFPVRSKGDFWAIFRKFQLCKIMFKILNTIQLSNCKWNHYLIDSRSRFLFIYLFFSL